MKKIKPLLAIMVAGLLIALFLSVCNSQLVRPFRVHLAISQGCHDLKKMKILASPTSEELDPVARKFADAARLDPRYIDLADDVLLWATDLAGNKGGVQNNPANSFEFLRAATTVMSFCL